MLKTSFLNKDWCGVHIKVSLAKTTPECLLCRWDCCCFLHRRSPCMTQMFFHNAKTTTKNKTPPHVVCMECSWRSQCLECALEFHQFLGKLHLKMDIEEVDKKRWSMWLWCFMCCNHSACEGDTVSHWKVVWCGADVVNIDVIWWSKWNWNKVVLFFLVCALWKTGDCKEKNIVSVLCFFCLTFLIVLDLCIWFHYPL